MDENIGYNGAYTGSQIDAAIGAVRNKETTWDGKQDKLTGVQGQVVGFDDDGDAVAMPAPDTGVTTFNGRTGAVIPGEDDYSAAMIKFADGETFQQKYDAGELTGPQGKQGPKGDTGAPGADGAQGPAGENGGYYTPAVSDTGNLTWTASKAGMPSVAGSNIKGQKGDKGDPGDPGAQGPAGADGAPGAAATINGVNALTLNATGGLSGSQSGNAYTIDGSGLKPIKVPITIPTTGWTNNQQTFAVNGIPADPENHEVGLATTGATNTQACFDAGLHILDEAENSLTLAVSTVPTVAFEVRAIITMLQ